MQVDHLPDVYTPGEIAEAAGVPDREVARLIASGEIHLLPNPGRYAVHARSDELIAHADAVRAVRLLRSAARSEEAVPSERRMLARATPSHRNTWVPLLVSTSLHLIVLALVLLASLRLTSADEPAETVTAVTPVRLVYLALPGPGGGGGGGGLRAPAPPPKAERRGTRAVSSPIPARRVPPPIRPQPAPPEPPPVPLEAKELPPVVVPVAPVAADPQEREGLIDQAKREAPPSRGAGSGGGSGAGQGSGIGEGDGSGIGPGQGGGMGGGPYRPGSGVDPPRLVKEVRADYSEAARRANLRGEVILEIVVRRDGSVGDVRIVRRLGSGLDERAVEAVRQWRFSPARLKGTPVDVLVEVAVEFQLR